MSKAPLPTRGVHLAIVALLVAVTALGLAIGGCSDGTTETTGTSGSVTSSTISDGLTTTTAPVQLSELDKELARTAKAQNALSGMLKDLGLPETDPAFGIVYALHARAQAVGCLQMLNKGDTASLDVADGVMLDIYHLLNLARDTAGGSAAQTIATGRAVADKIGAPSDHLDEAKDLLAQFVAALAPLFDELETIFTHVVAEHPDYAPAYSYLADRLVERGDINGALAILDQGVAATSGDGKTTLEKLRTSLAAATSTT